jgi:hypothetical protein
MDEKTERCQAGASSAAVSSSRESALQSGAELAATGETFRDTLGGSLEVMDGGAWTSIPSSAQRAIRRMHKTMGFMAEEHNRQVSRLSEMMGENERLREVHRQQDLKKFELQIALRAIAEQTVSFEECRAIALEALSNAHLDFRLTA